MSISLKCQNCGKPCTAGDDAVGMTVECTQCGQRMTIPQAGSTAAPIDSGSTAASPRPGATRGGSTGMTFRIGTTAVLIVVVLIGVRIHYRSQLRRIWEQVPAAVRAAATNQDGPIETPPLPDVGGGREIEPGVMFHEVRLPGGDKPGFAGKLWLYLPAGDHADHSLPCVLITAGGPAF
jgi:DNA-directed RNA polymerase subunit RPC12/RpoP